MGEGPVQGVGSAHAGPFHGRWGAADVHCAHRQLTRILHADPLGELSRQGSCNPCAHTVTGIPVATLMHVQG